MNILSLARKANVLSALVLAALAIGCTEPQATTSPKDQQAGVIAPRLTAGIGLAGTLLARGTSDGRFKLKRKNGKWEFDLDAHDPTDVAVQQLTFQPGGTSGWHSHPGPVILQVTSGTVTFYEGNGPCTPETRTVGQLFIETGEHTHLGRNEGSTVATAIAIVFAPVGSVLRIDEPAPGNCPF